MVCVSTISNKIIKPSSPTLSTQRWHKLSFSDQGFTNFYIPIVLFFPKLQVDIIPNGPKQVSKLLENSLSKTLISYYPWAGSLKDNATIDCDSTGAEFLEVQIDSSLDKVLHNPDSKIKDLTFPRGVPWRNSKSRALTIVQLSYFNCGGIAISVCLSHKVGDGSSALYFIRDWAALTKDANTKVCPYFVEDSIIQSPLDGPLVSPIFKSHKEGCIQKRFVFSPSKLCALKALVAAESGVLNPTRNEVVSALLCKTAIVASRATTHTFQPSQLVLLANIRGTISPPLPPNSVGNLLTVFSTPIYNNEDELKLPKLVADIRNSKHKLSTRDNVKDNEFVHEMVEACRTGEETYHQRNCVIYHCSSLSSFPFQDLDFGWGKPARTSLGIGPLCNTFYLMSNHDGGIDAHVTLNEQDMPMFENDEHLLEFATPIGHDIFYEEQQYTCV